MEAATSSREALTFLNLYDNISLKHSSVFFFTGGSVSLESLPASQVFHVVFSSVAQKSKRDCPRAVISVGVQQHVGDRWGLIVV